MLCEKCREHPVRVKQSKEGFLFGACEGFPTCKNSIHLPRNIRNFLVSNDQCMTCAKSERGTVQKLRFDVYCPDEHESSESIQSLLEHCEFSFCVCPNCDENFTSLRELSKGITKACAKNTFTDCQRKTTAELKEIHERFGGRKKRNFKAFSKRKS